MTNIARSAVTWDCTRERPGDRVRGESYADSEGAGNAGSERRYLNTDEAYHHFVEGAYNGALVETGDHGIWDPDDRVTAPNYRLWVHARDYPC